MSGDPRKLDFKDPKNTKLDIQRRNFTPEVSRKVKKGRKGQGEAMAKTKSIAPSVLKENLLQALEKSLGVVTTACRAIGCSRDMHYYLYHNDDDYKKRYQELSNVALDFVESQLFQKIRERDSACIIFYLKTKGKERGYVERVETEHTHNHKFDLKKLTEDELIQYAALQMKMDDGSSAEVIP